MTEKIFRSSHCLVMKMGGTLLSLCGSHIDEATSVAALGEEHRAVNESVDSVILAHAYILARVVHCTALTLDDVTCLASLTAKNLDAETFAF